ncbi:MAG TPA: hypothetical protein VH814_25090 [Steroidobacteraceae bacterium]|jgi:hypothetical protein
MRSHATRRTRHYAALDRPFSEYALQVWTMVARHGMTPALAARRLETSTWRVERIVVGVSRRNANRW